MGPLNGFKFLEIAGVGPTQLCGMLLADMGGDVVRIERPAAGDLGLNLPTELDLMNRSRRSVTLDLKHADGPAVLLRLAERADALFEGFRPGVMERLGVGPDACAERNPRLVYGRMTGWGQDGPMAAAAGHDPNYIGLTGVLHAIGPKDGDPTLPLNLIGDFGGGALYLAMGMLAALLERQRSGRGQVVDAAMVDGSASLMTFIHGLRAGGRWGERRGSNILDGGAPFARPYRTKDDRYVVVAALEERFYGLLLDGLDIPEAERIDRDRTENWPALEDQLASVIETRTRDEWCERFAGVDACLTPLLSMTEAPDHEHLRARETYVEVEGIRQPAPAPRFDRTPGRIRNPPPERGRDTRDVLSEWGFSADEIGALESRGVIGSRAAL